MGYPSEGLAFCLHHGMRCSLATTSTSWVYCVTDMVAYEAVTMQLHILTVHVTWCGYTLSRKLIVLSTGVVVELGSNSEHQKVITLDQQVVVCRLSVAYVLWLNGAS